MLTSLLYRQDSNTSFKYRACPAMVESRRGGGGGGQIGYSSKFLVGVCGLLCEINNQVQTNCSKCIPNFRLKWLENHTF